MRINFIYPAVTQICQGNGELSSFGAASVNAVLINAHQLVETIRSEVKDGELVVTPETITSYTYDAAGRTLSVRRDVGAMTTTESTAYDLLGRVIKQIDVLGRETATDYSADG